jgi:amphi-Trp domain-containing protein
MSQDDKFEFESVQDCQTIQKYLQALREGFEQGRIVLNSDGAEICMHPGGFMKFEVAVKKKGWRTSWPSRVSWKDKTEDSPAAGNISISS